MCVEQSAPSGPGSLDVNKTHNGAELPVRPFQYSPGPATAIEPMGFRAGEAHSAYFLVSSAFLVEGF